MRKILIGGIAVVLVCAAGYFGLQFYLQQRIAGRGRRGAGADPRGRRERDARQPDFDLLSRTRQHRRHRDEVRRDARGRCEDRPLHRGGRRRDAARALRGRAHRHRRGRGRRHARDARRAEGRLQGAADRDRELFGPGVRAAPVRPGLAARPLALRVRAFRSRERDRDHGPNRDGVDDARCGCQGGRRGRVHLFGDRARATFEPGGSAR